MFSPTLMTSNSSKKNAKQQLQALIALEVSRGNSNEDEILQKLLINSSHNNIHKLAGQVQKQQVNPRTSSTTAASNKKFDELFGDEDDDDETDEENDQNDGVVWNCNDDDDNDQDDNEKDEILFINDGQDYYDENENFQRQEDEDEKELHELGFLNKRHALFCCANIEPDPREYEMWSQNYHQHQQHQQRCDSSMTKRSTSACSTPLYNHHQQTTTEHTSNSSIISIRTSPTNTKQIHHHWKEIIQQQQQEQNVQSHTNNFSTSSISPQHLFGFKQSQQQRPLVSFPELIEFEHGPAIVNRIPHEVVKKQLSVDDSLMLLSRIFSEAVESGGGSARILCECIIGLEKIIAFVMTHPTLSTSSVAEDAVKLLVHKMFLDILPVWHLVQTSPVVDCSSSSSSSSVYDVLNIFVETFLTGGKGGRKVVNLVTKKFSEESVHVLRACRQRAHPFARLALKKIFAMKNVVEQNNQSNRSAVMEELLKLAV